MQRREFLTRLLASSGVLKLGAQAQTPDNVYFERPLEGRPHAGKVLAAIQPHSDDVPLFCGGTVAKLIHEGYTGYLIRTTNDDAAGSGNTFGEVVSNNERDTEAVADRKSVV